MPLDIINASYQTTPQPRCSSRNANHRPNNNVNIVQHERIPTGSEKPVVNDCVQKWEPSNQKVVTVSRGCSPQANCQCCEFIESSYWEPASDGLPVPPSSTPCALCMSEHLVPRPRQSAFERNPCPPLPICVDPACLENVCQECPESACEECSNHEEGCEECVAECASECKDTFCGDGMGCTIQGAQTVDDSYSELFGDFTAQIFNREGSLPQLSTYTAPLHLDDAPLYPDNADLPALDGQDVFENDFGSYDKPKPPCIPAQLCREHEGSEAFSYVYPGSCMSSGPVSALDSRLTSWIAVAGEAATKGTICAAASSQKPQLNEHSSNLTSRTSPRMHVPHLAISAQVAQKKAVPIAPADSNPPQDAGLTLSMPSPSRPVRLSTQCQWIDSNNHSCGKVFELGVNLHEHLKNAHNVKCEVFCRWKGCSFGVHGSTPHRYANSIERHTWGHSGYRPYKCPTCSEGFAAANVRDEHFANFHLKRKMFSCDVCTHQCTSARNLKRHKDDTHTTERFQCEFCNRSGKIRLFPRASNLARHFRKCKCVLALYPDAAGAVTGKIDDSWFPIGYRSGHQGMDKAKVLPPNYLPVTR